MYKIYLAVGHKDLNSFIVEHKALIERYMNNEIEFIHGNIYREGILQGVLDEKPNLILLRETLQGEMSAFQLLHEIKMHSPDTRVILITGNRMPGDPFLKAVIDLGIYDLLIGDHVNASEMLKRIVYPNKYSDIINLLPKMDIQETYTPAPSVIAHPPKTIQPGYAEIDKTVQEEKERMDSVTEEVQEKKGFSLFNKKPEMPTFNKPEKSEKPAKPLFTKKGKAKEEVVEEKSDKNQKKGFSLFGKKEKEKDMKTINQKIVTFVGGHGGVGNSNIAFNTAIGLANQGFKVLYMDLDNEYSSIDNIFEFGFYDHGIDTALEPAYMGDKVTVAKSIVELPKLMSVLSKKDKLWKSYAKMPSNLEFMFFSQLCMNGKVNPKADFPKFRDLIKMLVSDFKYDIIVLDAPSNAKNPLTQMAIAYAEKVFFTVVQDSPIISSFIKGTKVLDAKNINYKKKMNIIINKFEKCEFTEKHVSKLITENLEVTDFKVFKIPNLSKEYISAAVNKTPIILHTKNKELLAIFAELEKYIEV